LCVVLYSASEVNYICEMEQHCRDKLTECTTITWNYIFLIGGLPGILFGSIAFPCTVIGQVYEEYTGTIGTQK